MGKPTEAELKTALAEAARMREHNEDPHFIAKSLLNLNYRLNHLEKVFHITERYLHSGMSPSDHTKLIHAIEQFNKLDRRTSGEDNNSFPIF